MKRGRVWLLYLVLGSIASAAYLFVRSLDIGVIVSLIGLSAPIAVVVGVRVNRPSHPLPWYLFALGQAMFVAGDVLTRNHEWFFGRDLTYPSLGDLPSVGVYPCLLAGALFLIHGRDPGRDRADMIDSVIIAMGVGLLSWVLMMTPYTHDRVLTPAQKLVSTGYPLMDLLLLTVAVRLVFGAGRRSPAFYLMVMAAIALFATDAAVGWAGLRGRYMAEGLMEAGWMSSYLLWGAAALHPSMRSLSYPGADRESRLTKTRLAMLTTASLMGPVAMSVQKLRGESEGWPVVLAASAILLLLVMARMAGLIHKQEQSARREKALRSAAASLVTATNRSSIYEATLESARSLAGDAAAIRVLVGPDDRGEFAVVASTEDLGVGRPGRVSPSNLERERLLRGNSVRTLVSESTISRSLFRPDEAVTSFAAPLFSRDQLKGILCVGGTWGLGRASREGLEVLASQVALALESAALTEDLLRRETEARFRSLVQNSSDLVMVIDADTTVRYVSPSVDRVLGYLPEVLMSRKLDMLIHPDDRTRVLGFLASATRDSDPHPALIEFRVRHRDDYWLHVETLRTNLLNDPNVQGIVLNTRDISERKAFEEQLARQAFHDPVTDLANRALFKDRVGHALERQRRDDTPLAVLLMDLDDFKTINDSLGHAAGDRLLGEVGERLKRCLRAVDTAARLGGDEFAILLEDGGQGVEPADVAARIMDALEAPFDLEGKEVFVRTSIGIASGETERQGPEGAEEILRNADVAMYMAKGSGKDRYQMFEPAMHETALRRLELKADLQRAVEKREFVLHYQPVIELDSGRITGVEALIRWQHPRHGMMAPAEFVPLAEETGLIVPVGTWVLEEACRQARVFQERYPTDPSLHMAVNLSARELQRPGIAADVARVLLDTGLDPSTLILEITESVMMRDMELSTKRLLELKELGVQLAVDDFGTGYSSLNYIRRFPVDILKIDKSFIDVVTEGGREAALTAAIMELAGILKLRPVAEGIERPDQLERLLELKCDLGQGFYFAKPLPAQGIEELLAARTALADRDHELAG